jgi:hypothetical protein
VELSAQQSIEQSVCEAHVGYDWFVVLRRHLETIGVEQHQDESLMNLKIGFVNTNLKNYTGDYN